MLFQRFLRAVGLVGLVLGAWAAIQAQGYDPQLEYRGRGAYYEGLRARPVSGNAQLLSVRVVESRPAGAASSSAGSWGKQATLRFFLPYHGDVSVTVRPARSGSLYYVLDRVVGSWMAGEVNRFSWDTVPVLQVLQRSRRLQPADLGAVVNLGPGKDTNRERVLPVVLFDDVVENGPKVYRFTLKTDARVRVTAKVYKEKEARPLFERPANTEEPGSPFTIVWQADKADQDEWYRLVLQGPFEDGSKLDKEVLFFHRRAMGIGANAR